VKAIIPLTQVTTDLITVTGLGHTTEEARSWSRSAIDLTIAVPVTGTGARITSGNQVTGHGGTVSKSGSVAITSYADTERRVGRLNSRAERGQASDARMCSRS
jgi:hypothetical protein